MVGSVYQYDANGNLTNEISEAETRAFSWDAENRLVRIQYGSTSNYTRFEYDGLSRLASITEVSMGATVDVSKVLWNGLKQCELRGADGSNVLVRYFANGIVVLDSSTNTGGYVFIRDHLGSVRGVVDASGTLTTRYDYGPWGDRLKVTGDFDVALGFTGHRYHQRSCLHLAPYRAYDTDMARWLSRDPIGERGGINLYTYVENSPTYYNDPSGLMLMPGYGAAIGFIYICAAEIPENCADAPAWQHCMANCLAGRFGDPSWVLGTEILAFFSELLGLDDRFPSLALWRGFGSARWREVEINLDAFLHGLNPFSNACKDYCNNLYCN